MPYISLLIFLLILYFYLSTMWTNARGAPWVPTGGKKIIKMLEMANLQAGETLYDLGAGDGRVLWIAAQKFGAKAVGIEIDPLRYLWMRLWIKLLKQSGSIRVIRDDFFKINLHAADVVFCYLLPRTNHQLQEKFLEELPMGARIICNTFPLLGLPIAAQDEKARIYLHIR